MTIINQSDLLQHSAAHFVLGNFVVSLREYAVVWITTRAASSPIAW